MRYLLATTLTALALMTAATFAQELPSDAQKLVREFEKATGQVELKAAAENDAAVAAALKSLAQIQDRLTKAGQLDEAVAVRDWLRKAGRPTWDDEQTRRRFESTTGLPEDAAAVVSKTAKETTERAATAEKSTGAAREALRVKLSDLLKSYSSAGKLDEAIVIRNHIKSLAESGRAVPGISPALIAPTAGSSRLDLEAREKAAAAEAAAIRITSASEALQHAAQFHARQQQEIDADFQRSLTEVLPRLREQQAGHTKAGRLDEAVALRDVLTALDKSDKAGDQRKLLSEAKVRPRLPGDSVALIGELLRIDSIHSTEATRVRLAFNAPLIGQLEALAARSLIAGDLEKARGELSQIAGFQGRAFAYSWSGHYRQKPVVPDALAPALEAFHKATETRRAKADAQEAALRKELLVTLNGIKTDVPAEKTAVSKTVAFLEADWSAGLRGLLLFAADRQLPAGALAAVQSYVTTTRDMRTALKTEQEAAAKTFRSETQPVIERLVKELELEAAFVALDCQGTLSRVFEPLPVKAFRNNFRNHAWDAELIDFRKSELLIRWTQGTSEEWVTRDSIALDGEFEPRSPTAGGSGRPNEPAAPGEAVTARTSLKVGQSLRCEWGSRWLPVTVLALSPSGVKIHWEGYSDGFDEFVPRSRLRMVEAE